MISTNIFTELKFDHPELTNFCQAFRSRLIKILVSLEQNILFHQMTCACSCEPLVVSWNIAPL